MPRTPPGHRSRFLLALLLVVGLVAGACGNSDDDGDTASGGDTTAPSGGGTPVDAPGVTDTEIRFAAFGTNSSNPLGTCVLDCYVDGIKAYFEYRNSEGGVHGRTLVLSKELDDQLAKNKERALEIVAANDVFGAFSATQIASGWADVQKAGIPLYVWNIHPAEAAHEATFPSAYGVICITCPTRANAYAAKLAGATKVAALGYGVSQNSKISSQTTAATIEKFSADIGGAKVVYRNDEIAFGMPNGIAPEVTAMKRAGVDMIFASIDLNGMKTLAQELARQGMGDVTMYHPNTYDAKFIAAAGDLFEGDYVSVGFRPFESEGGDSDLDLFREWMEKTGSELTEISMHGWINAALAYQGILDAGGDFSREKVVAATNEITDWTAGGLIAPIDWTRQHVAPDPANPGPNGPKHDCTSFVQVKDGKLAMVGDATKPFICWPGEHRNWVEPTRESFE